MKKDFAQLRQDFPMLSGNVGEYPLVYLDNAATTQKPQVVIDALVRFYTSQYASTGRGVYPLAEQATQLFEDARSACTRFIGAASSSEIVFTSGATDSITTVVHAWALQHITDQDIIVISELEHHANLLSWQFVAQITGAQLKYIPVTPEGDLAYDILDDIICTKTAFVAVTHTSNALGVKVDCKRIVQRARSVGAKVLIDASQAMIHQKVDVQELDCDFLVFSGHKMLAPTGIGVLYVKQELHDQLLPFRRGGGMVYWVSYQKAQWAAMPQLLQAGTMPIAQSIGLHAAIDYISHNIDWQALGDHENSLNRYLIDNLQQNEKITILGPIDLLKEKGHQVSFLVQNIHSHDVAAFLGQLGICVRAGHHCAQPLAEKLGSPSSVRVSFAFYNTKKEVDCLIAALNQLFEQV